VHGYEFLTCPFSLHSESASRVSQKGPVRMRDPSAAPVPDKFLIFIEPGCNDGAEAGGLCLGLAMRRADLAAHMGMPTDGN